MAADDVQIRLRMLGAAVFARDAKTVAREMRNIGPAGDRAAGGLRSAQGPASKTQQLLRRLGGTASTARGQVSAFGSGATAALGTAGMTGVVGGALKVFTGFEQQMDKVAAVSDASAAQMGRLNEQAMNLGGSTSFSNRQVAAGMTELATAGFTVRDIMKSIPGTLDLAAASGVDLADAAALQASTLRAFMIPAKDAGRVADVLAMAVNRSAIDMSDLGYTMKYVAPVAGRFNQSFEDMAASAAILGNVGIKGETAGTTLRKALTSVINPSKKTMDVLDGAGISADKFRQITQTAQGELKPFPQMLGGLASALSKVDGATQRKALQQLFGVEALPGMVTLFAEGEGGIMKMSRALAKSEGTAKKTAGVMRGNVAGAWDEFTGSLESASTRIVRRFSPALQGGLRGAAGGINGFAKRAESFIGGIDFAGIAKKIGGVGKQVIGALAPAMPFLENVVLPLLKGVAEGVIAGIVMAFKIAVPLVRVFATAIGWIGQKAAPIKGVFQGIGHVVGVIFGGPILGIIGLLGKLGGVFRIVGVAARVLAVPIQIVGFAARGVAKGIGFLAGAFVRVHGTAMRFAATFRGVVRSVVVGAGNMVGAVINRVEAIVKGIVGLVPKFLHAGETLGTKLVQGIKGIFTSGPDFVKDLGKSIANAVIGLLNGAIPNKIPVPGAPDINLPNNPIPKLATGGSIVGSGWAVVGERGPELAHLPKGSSVYSNRESMKMPGFLRGASSSSRSASTDPATAAGGARPIYLVLREGGRVLAEALAADEALAGSMT